MIVQMRVVFGQWPLVGRCATKWRLSLFTLGDIDAILKFLKKKGKNIDILSSMLFNFTLHSGLTWVDLFDGKVTLHKVMVWCFQVASHYLNHSWPGSMIPKSVSMVDRLTIEEHLRHIEEGKTWLLFVEILTIYLSIYLILPPWVECHWS